MNHSGRVAIAVAALMFLAGCGISPSSLNAKAENVTSKSTLTNVENNTSFASTQNKNTLVLPTGTSIPESKLKSYYDTSVKNVIYTWIASKNEHPTYVISMGKPDASMMPVVTASEQASVFAWSKMNLTRDYPRILKTGVLESSFPWSFFVTMLPPATKGEAETWLSWAFNYMSTYPTLFYEQKSIQSILPATNPKQEGVISSTSISIGNLQIVRVDQNGKMQYQLWNFKEQKNISVFYSQTEQNAVSIIESNTDAMSLLMTP